MKKYLEIIDTKKKKVVKRLDVTVFSLRGINNIDRSLNIILNHDRFYTSLNITKRKYNC